MQINLFDATYNRKNNLHDIFHEQALFVCIEVKIHILILLDILYHK